MEFQPSPDTFHPAVSMSVDDVTGNLIVTAKSDGRTLGFAVTPKGASDTDAFGEICKMYAQLRDALYASITMDDEQFANHFSCVKRAA